MEKYHIIKKFKELCPDGSLTAEKNELLFRKYEEDKLNNVPPEDSVARTLLIMGNRKLVYYILKRDFSLFCDFENLEESSVGHIGLIKAVDTYDVNNNAKFTTYAHTVIKNEILMYYRKQNTQSAIAERNKIYLDEPIADLKDDDDILTILDTLQNPDDFVEQVVIQEEAKRFIKNIKYLTVKEAITIIYSFGLFGKPILDQGQIAKLQGVARCNISRSYGSGLKKLRMLTFKESELSAEELEAKHRILKKGPQNDIVERLQEENNSISL